MRLHRARLGDGEWTNLGGLLVTRPARMAADLLAVREDPGAVAQIIADGLRAGHARPGTVARTIAPYAARFGLPAGDGLALLRWLLDLARDPDADAWLARARASSMRGRDEGRRP